MRIQRLQVRVLPGAQIKESKAKMKEVHHEFRLFNPLGWEQPKIFRMYQFTRVRRMRGGMEIIQREIDLFSYKEMVKMHRLKRRYRKEEKEPIVYWKTLIKELEESV